jgi:TonB-dependent receptor
MHTNSPAQPRLAALPFLIASVLASGFALTYPERVIAQAEQGAEVRGLIVDAAGLPVAGAEVMVMGVSEAVYDESHKLVSDAAGSFSLRLPNGDYGVMVDLAGYESFSASNYAIRAATASEWKIVLKAAGASAAVDSEPTSVSAAEIEAVPPAEVGDVADATEMTGVEVEGSISEGGQELYVDERRTTANVTEAVSAEQIARTGDSDAASTLKRVTGLTVVDSKYVFVRGLGDRYSSVLLNGAQIPSPDPTRRTLPLDLFPTEILEGVVIQKSWSPDLPAEFGGGTVQLRTRGVPAGFVAKLGLSTGYQQGSTFDDGLSYSGDSQDWTGFDGGRGLPAELAAAISNGTVLRPQSPTNPNGVSPAELERFGEALAGNYDVDSSTRIKPDAGMSAALGNSFEFGDNKLGLLGALRYSNTYDQLDEVRREFAVVGADELTQTSELDVQRSLQNFELSGFLVAGLDIGSDHRLKSTTLLLRSTEDETQVATGYPEDPADVSRFTQLEWIENALIAEQLAGEHRFPDLKDLSFNWQYTIAQATRESPNTRNYRYDRNNSSNLFSFSRRSDSNFTTFADLEDNSDDFSFAFKLPTMLNDETYLDLSAGGGVLRRDRDSEIRRFSFSGVGRLANDPNVIGNNTLDNILNPANIGPNGFELRETTRATDNYVADQDLDALFIGADLNFRSKYRFTGGLRYEDNAQQVSTFQLGVPDALPVVASISTADWLPSLGFTWLYADNDQLRFSVAETVSRPDFRELSSAPYTDPLLDLETIGNPELKPTSIRHFDARWEHYFSYTETLSIAAFLKDFDLPIEKIQVPGTGSLVSLANAESARNYGIEIDYFRGLGFLNERLEQFYTAVNFSWIESKIELGTANDIQTNESRPLQGQSPYVVNLQLGYKSPNGGDEATLLYNVAGKRISQVGVFGAPDIYEQPFNALDFNWRHSLSEAWTLKLRLRNLLDPKVEYQQGDETTRVYRRGREVGLSLEWQP